MKEVLQQFFFGEGFQNGVGNTGKLLMRVLFGLSLSLNHGWPTFKAAIGGASDFPDPLGIGPGVSILLAGTAEFIFALFVVLGFITRLSLIPVLFNFAVAFFVFHAGDPFGQKEMAYIYLSAMTVIMLLGPGKYSIDYVLFYRKRKS